MGDTWYIIKIMGSFLYVICVTLAQCVDNICCVVYTFQSYRAKYMYINSFEIKCKLKILNQTKVLA